MLAYMSIFSCCFDAVVTHPLLLRTKATCRDINKNQLNIGHVNFPLEAYAAAVIVSLHTKTYS